jgi:hypothetical protein
VARLTSGPGAVTGAATEIGARSATVAGTVRAKGQLTIYGFEYGTTSAYGSQTTPGSAGQGVAPVEVSQAISGLAPDTLYHYRLTATNDADTTVGDDQTFTTATEPPPDGGADTTPPSGTLSGKRTQDVDKLALTVGSNEAGSVNGQASVTVPGAKKPVTSKPVSGSVATTGTLKLKFKFKKKSLRKIKKAIAKGKKPKAKINVTITDGAANKSTLNKTVKLMD